MGLFRGYTFVLKHKSGKQNQVADALSRRTALLTTMVAEVIGFDTIKTLYATDDDFWEIVEQLNGSSIGSTSHVQGDYFLQDGYLQGKATMYTSWLYA